MALFSESDRRLIETLVYDPGLVPGYEVLRGCLVWQDENRDDLSREGQRRIHDLQAARSLLFHRTARTGQWSAETEKFFESIRPKYRAIWGQAIAENLRWPGFHPSGIALSDELLDTYRRMIDEPL